MASICDVADEIFSSLPQGQRLSDRRMANLVYLCDWRHSIVFDKQMTSIRWECDSTGPTSPDVFKAFHGNPRYMVLRVRGFEDSIFLFESTNDRLVTNLSKDEKAIVQHIAAINKRYDWPGLVRLVYSTYPILSSELYSTLDLPKAAREYAKVQQEIEHKRQVAQ